MKRSSEAGRPTRQKRMHQAFYVNRTLLVFAGFGLGLWLIGVPVMLGLSTNFSTWLSYAVLGMLLLPCVLILMILLRVLVWFLLYAYWTLMAVLGAFLMIGLAGVITMAATNRSVVLIQTKSIVVPEVSLRSLLGSEPARVPTGVFVAVAIAFVIVFFLLWAVWKIERDSVSSRVTEDVAVPRVEFTDVKELTYLQERQKSKDV